MQYTPDEIESAADFMISEFSGPEPHFDAVTRDLLLEGYADLKRRCAQGGLLQFASLGKRTPWLYRLTFGTTGFVREDGDGEILQVNRHVIALRFLPDYLRHANRFDMLRIVQPQSPPPFHPNISSEGAICIEVYPGESPVEICESLHDLLRWRLRQYDERDALNKDACAWGREHIHQAIDDRQLFGSTLQITLEPVGDDHERAT